MNKLTKVIGHAGISGLLITGLSGWHDAAHAATPISYSGRATAVSANATVVLLKPKVVIGDTGELDPSGATRDATAATVNVPLPINVHSATISAYTSGSGGVSSSSAALQKLQISVAGLLQISADAVDAESSAQCKSGSTPAGTSGSSTIVNLKINGIIINTAVAPNITVTIPIPLVGSVTLNEQTKADANTIAVNAVHVMASVLGLAGADVVIGHAESGVKNCP